LSFQLHYIISQQFLLLNLKQISILYFLMTFGKLLFVFSDSQWFHVFYHVSFNDFLHCIIFVSLPFTDSLIISLWRNVEVKHTKFWKKTFFYNFMPGKSIWNCVQDQNKLYFVLNHFQHFFERNRDTILPVYHSTSLPFYKCFINYLFNRLSWFAMTWISK